jgi:hypothetical protein
VEAFDVRVLDRLAGRDVVEPDAVRGRPLVARPTDELGTVVDDELLGMPTGLGEPIEDIDHAGTRE